MPQQDELVFWMFLQRIVGIVPMVMDLLKSVENLHHFYRSLGGWPISFAPYHLCNVTANLDTLEFSQLMVSARTCSFGDFLIVILYCKIRVAFCYSKKLIILELKALKDSLKSISFAPYHLCNVTANLDTLEFFQIMVSVRTCSFGDFLIVILYCKIRVAFCYSKKWIFLELKALKDSFKSSIWEKYFQLVHVAFTAFVIDIICFWTRQLLTHMCILTASPCQNSSSALRMMSFSFWMTRTTQNPLCLHPGICLQVLSRLVEFLVNQALQWEIYVVLSCLFWN